MLTLEQINDIIFKLKFDYTEPNFDKPGYMFEILKKYFEQERKIYVN